MAERRILVCDICGQENAHPIKVYILKTLVGKSLTCYLNSVAHICKDCDETVRLGLKKAEASL